MVRIPTPIPKSTVQTIKGVLSGSLGDVLWKIFVITVGLLVVYAALSSAGALLVTLGGIAASYIFADDIRALANDIWTRNFWVWRVDP